MVYSEEELDYLLDNVVKLDDILEYEQPTKYLVDDTKKAYRDRKSGIPVLTPGQTFILGYTDETTGIYSASKTDPIILFDDFTASFKWVDFSFKIKSSAIKILKAKDPTKVNLKFVYYLMTTLEFKPTTHQRQYISSYSQQTIYLPSLEVQNRIVSILDNFSQYISILSEATGLSLEIELRQQQYQYYSELLLKPFITKE